MVTIFSSMTSGLNLKYLASSAIDGHVKRDHICCCGKSLKALSVYSPATF